MADGGDDDFVLVDGENRRTDPRAALFNAYVSRRAAVTFKIVRAAEDGRAEVLFEAVVPVGRRFEKSLAFVEQRLPDWLALARDRARKGVSLGGAPAPLAARPVSGRRGPRFYWAFFLAAVSFARELFSVEQWNVALLPMDNPNEVMAPLDWSKVRWVPGPERRTFIADPFLLSAGGGQASVLCEYFDYRSAKGVLERIELDGGGSIAERRVVLEEDVHLSYPCIFEDGGETYVLPEMEESGGAHIYRLADGGNLERVATILPEVPLVDGTLFRHGGRLWLFGSRTDHDCMLNLYAWHAATVEGPWHEHALNPIKTDIRSCRPAGPVLSLDAGLIRPAQDCARTYGGAITLNRIDTLTPDTFHETTLVTIEPDRSQPFPHGVHTIGYRNGVLVIDAKRQAFDFRGPHWHRFIAERSAGRRSNI